MLIIYAMLAPRTDPVGDILSVMPFSSFMSCSLHRLNRLVISYLFMSPSFVSCSLHRQRGNYWIRSKHLGEQCREFPIPSGQITYDFLYYCLSTVFGPRPFQTSKSELPQWQWFQTRGHLVPPYKFTDRASRTNELLSLSISLLFQQEIVMASARLWRPRRDKSLILFAGSSVSYLFITKVEQVRAVSIPLRATPCPARSLKLHAPQSQWQDRQPPIPFLDSIHTASIEWRQAGSASTAGQGQSTKEIIHPVWVSISPNVPTPILLNESFFISTCLIFDIRETFAVWVSFSTSNPSKIIGFSQPFSTIDLDPGIPRKGVCGSSRFVDCRDSSVETKNR